ncbi:unnamed protein product [Sympodiomycopsis kandeliae]
MPSSAPAILLRHRLIASPSSRLGRLSVAPPVARLAHLQQRHIHSTHPSSKPAPTHANSTSATKSSASPLGGTATSTPSSAAAASPPPSFLSHSALPHVSHDEKIARVTWASGIESRYHHLWLRDHCRCPTCYHPKTKQRLLNTFAIAPDVQPLATEATTEGLKVTWPPLASTFDHGTADQQQTSNTASSDPASSPASPSSEIFESPESQPHTALYPWKWLRTNSYAPPLDQPHHRSLTGQDDLIGLGKTLWGKGIESHPPTVAYEEIMAGDEGVWKWLEKISQYGFSFVSGVPATPQATEELIQRIAFIRETHYGGFWDFTSDLSHGDTAYTDIALGAHTDTTYFTDPAGLQMFHLLSHTASSSTGVPASGGESLMVDGFLAARVLRDVHPEAYETLSTTRISTHSAGDENTLVRPLLRGGYPILDHDPKTGKLVMVRYNNDDRSTLRVDEDKVEAFYDALRKWHTILTNTEGEFWSQLKPGNPIIFDNHRILHGRSSFVGNRRLCGAYINHDDYRSRLDVLRNRFGKNSEGKKVVTSQAERSVWDDAI